MPAHIFTRLGMWQEALASCQSAWDVSQGWIENAKLTTDNRDYHSLQWIITIDVELGKLRAAEAALQRFLDGARHGGAGTRSWYAAVLLDHLRATQEWSRLAELSAPPPDGDGAATAGPACHGPAHPERDRAERLRVETQRWAAAARHEAAEVARLNGLLVDLRQRLAGEREKRMGHEIYVRFVEEETLTDAALLATAKRDATTAAARWRDLAVLEDRDPPLEGADGQGGAHFLAGVTLLEAGRAADARAELAHSLARYPAHTATFLALARALDRLGDVAGARANYARALAGWKEADADFKPAVEARAWLEAHPTTAAR
jgi:hypothetical protein